ncbi:MAG: helix-turn-helix domain-containing protein [Anaerolineae bacterium]
MALWGMPPASAAEIAALERDYRYADKRIVRQRSQIVLLAFDLNTQAEVARAARCSVDTVRRVLHIYRQGGRAALRQQPKRARGCVSLAWQKALAEAMRLGPQACGIPRPTWTAPLLSAYLAKVTGIAVSERTVRRGLALLDYVCRRPTWTVRHKAEEQVDYLPKRRGSRRS